MTLPALRALSPAQYQAFSKCFVLLVQADNRLGLFEWTLHQILLRHLRPQFETVRPPQVAYYGLQQLGEQVSILLSTLAHASQHDDELAFAAGAKRLSGVNVQLLPRESCGVGQLDAALRELAQGRAETAGSARRRQRGLHLCRPDRLTWKRASCCGRFAICSTARCRRFCPDSRCLRRCSQPQSASQV